MTVFRFHPFEFDPAAGLVYRGDEETLLPPKAAHVLQLLLENAGQLVSKDELLETIWEDGTLQFKSQNPDLAVVKSHQTSQTWGNKPVRVVIFND